MTKDDVRKMSDVQLVKTISFYNEKTGKPECAELFHRLKIMRELCEAMSAWETPGHDYVTLGRDLSRKQKSLESYRELEDEREIS